jgi:hypothetical protein
MEHWIRLPYESLQVCTISPIPAGYVIPQTLPSSSCNGGSAHEIRMPTNGMAICGYSPLPPGWVTQNQVRVSRCGTATYGWTIRSTP